MSGRRIDVLQGTGQTGRADVSGIIKCMTRVGQRETGRCTGGNSGKVVFVPDRFIEYEAQVTMELENVAGSEVPVGKAIGIRA